MPAKMLKMLLAADLLASAKNGEVNHKKTFPGQPETSFGFRILFCYCRVVSSEWSFSIFRPFAAIDFERLRRARSVKNTAMEPTTAPS